jgi:glycosyltransferase involved in cell wall biosynthesis
MTSKKTLSIVIPAYNEGRTVHFILDKIKSVELIEGIQKEVIIVNDCSKDNTEEAIQTYIQNNQELPISYFKHEVNMGKGAALHTGISKATGDYVIIQDADLEYDPSEIPNLWNEIKKNSAEVLLTSRLSGSKTTRVHYFWHKVGNRIITLFFNICNNTTFTDIYSGYLIFDISKINLSKLRFFGWGQQAEILTYLVKNSTKIYETPISYYGRTYEEGKKIRFISVFKVFMAIIITRFRP